MYVEERRERMLSERMSNKVERRERERKNRSKGTAELSYTTTRERGSARPNSQERQETRGKKERQIPIENQLRSIEGIIAENWSTNTASV